MHTVLIRIKLVNRLNDNSTIKLCGYSAQVRNLNYLNRDLDKVLLITANPDAHALQPDNAVKVRSPSCPW